MNFIKVSYLIAQTQCLANWGDFPYSFSLTFLSEPKTQAHSRLRHEDVRDAALELTLHSILTAYALYPQAEISWCILKKCSEGFHLHKERFITPTLIKKECK